MDTAPEITLSTGPVLLGLIFLGIILRNALERPAPIVRLREIWIAPPRVVRLSAAAGGGGTAAYVSIFLEDGTQLDLAPKDGETAAQLRDKAGKAIAKGRNLDP